MASLRVERSGFSGAHHGNEVAGNGAEAASADDFCPTASAGHLIRDANRVFQRALDERIGPAGVTRGQWHVLRVLWETDGLTQRELSARVGIMEPTAVVALNGMERAGLIRRKRCSRDRRKMHVFVSAKGRRLRDQLMPLARQVNEIASADIPDEDLEVFRRTLRRLIENLDDAAD
jgi:DNA-binding MarR family transcriptional regulator